MKKYISYIRVSTDKQNDSRLGIEAQQKINRNYILSVGGELIDEKIEVQTGTMDTRISIKYDLTLDLLLQNRPILRELISYCQKKNIILLVKDLSRLSRNTLLINYLIGAGIKFICAENPNDDIFMLQIRAVLAEEEARLISQRTIEALQSKKARGQKLGTPNPENLAKGRKIQAQKRKLKAREFYQKQINKILMLRKKGLSYKEIAEQLNEFGLKTKEGKDFKAMTIKRIINREGFN